MNKNLLIIDDNKHIRDLISLYLKDDFQIFTAPDGEKGLKIFFEKKIDIVISDMIMPLVDGIEVIQKIKNKNPSIPILAISGGGVKEGDDYLPLAKGFGVDSILHKPFTRKELISSIKQINR